MNSPVAPGRVLGVLTNTQVPYQVMSAQTKVTKTALKQETYNLSDLKHDLQLNTIGSKLRIATIALSPYHTL